MPPAGGVIFKGAAAGSGERLHQPVAPSAIDARHLADVGGEMAVSMNSASASCSGAGAIWPL